MPPRRMYFDAVRVGDLIPPTAKAPIDRVQLARYASAINDFNPAMLDEVYARSIGMPSVVAPPGLGMGFLGQLVTEWAKGAIITRISTRFIRTTWPGDTLVCKGRVTDRYGVDGRYFLELDLWAENQRGELAVKGNATVRLFYSAEDENRARLGQPPIIVNVPRQSILTAAAAPAPLRESPHHESVMNNSKTTPPMPQKSSAPGKPAPQKSAPRKSAPSSAGKSRATPATGGKKTGRTPVKKASAAAKKPNKKAAKKR